MVGTTSPHFKDKPAEKSCVWSRGSKNYFVGSQIKKEGKDDFPRPLGPPAPEDGGREGITEPPDPPLAWGPGMDRTWASVLVLPFAGLWLGKFSREGRKAAAETQGAKNEKGCVSTNSESSPLRSVK